MIKIYKKTLKDSAIKEIKDVERGSWVSVVNPSQEELDLLEKNLHLDPTILEDALDENEIPRLERNRGDFYMIIRFPLISNSGVTTMPLLVVVAEECLITLCKVENEIINNFTKEKVNFHTTQKTHFLFKIILEVFNNYDSYLNKILKDIKIKKIEIDNLGNKDILFLVQEEETLNNFESALVPIISILKKILRGRCITIYEKDKDVIEDLVMDSQQTLELSRVGLKSIKNIREAYSAILTNDLNKVIKVLTGVTIILTIPTIIGSIYGMNVRIPQEDDPNAFYYIIFTIIIMSVATFLILTKRKWI